MNFGSHHELQVWRRLSRGNCPANASIGIQRCESDRKLEARLVLAWRLPLFSAAGSISNFCQTGSQNHCRRPLTSLGVLNFEAWFRSVSDILLRQPTIIRRHALWSWDELKIIIEAPAPGRFRFTTRPIRNALLEKECGIILPWQWWI